MDKGSWVEAVEYYNWQKVLVAGELVGFFGTQFALLKENNRNVTTTVYKKNLRMPRNEIN